MREKKRGYKFFQAVLLAVFLLFLFIFSLSSLSDKELRNIAKNYIFYIVEQNEERLLSLAGKYTQENHSFTIHQYQRDEGKIPYRKMKDKEVSRAFRNFNLIYIEYFENGDTVFVCCPYIQMMTDDFYCGFYYSKSDEPRGLKESWDELIDDHSWIYEEKYPEKYYPDFSYEKSDSEGTYEEKSNGSYEWYHTEKIENHWWYFEWIWISSWKYVKKR